MQVEIQHYEFYNDDKEQTNVNPKSKLDKCLQSIVKKEGYVSCDISKKALAADGGNYLGALYEVDVKGKTSDGDKETAIFVKSITPDASIEIISIPNVYKTELFLYNEITKIFNELQNEGNVPANERYKTVKCYEESFDEAIIMENLNKKGFKTCYRMDIVTLEMAEECIKQLAKFHGLSFVLEQRRPEYFNRKIKNLKTCLNFGNGLKKLNEMCSKIAMKSLPEDLRSKIEGKLPNLLGKMKEYVTEESTKYCLCHGDYRPNNIMVKEEDGKVTEIIPVDYQLIFYGCPVIDFIYFIYFSTDRQFRKSHIAYLKNLYYQSLDQFLQYFDLSAEMVLPRKIFEKLYEDKLDYGLIMTIMSGPFLFASEDDEDNFPALTKEEVVKMDMKVDDRYKDRLKDAVEELIEMGYL